VRPPPTIGGFRLNESHGSPPDVPVTDADDVDVAVVVIAKGGKTNVPPVFSAAACSIVRSIVVDFFFLQIEPTASEPPLSRILFPISTTFSFNAKECV
jgi:hypothetical protein